MAIRRIKARGYTYRVGAATGNTWSKEATVREILDFIAIKHPDHSLNLEEIRIGVDHEYNYGDDDSWPTFSIVARETDEDFDFRKKQDALFRQRAADKVLKKREAEIATLRKLQEKYPDIKD
jgi:hypothetical protein